jgi:MoaA/NifB/PqqE/SkfB family radical SAM enzyme
MNTLNFPHRIAIEMTPLCNLSCPMCPRHHVSDLENHGYISRELWVKLIDEISMAAPEAVVLPFWRGESLLHPNFSEYLEYALAKSIRIHISTNGLLLNPQNSELLSNCEFVNISIHIDSALTQANKFQEYINRKSLKKPELQISFVSSEKSKKFIENIVASPSLGGFDCVRLYEEHSKDGLFGNIGAPVHISRTYCPKLRDTFVIAYDGSFSRCSHIWKPEDGDNLNYVSIIEAWESAAMEEIRSAYPDQHCSSCDQWIGRTLGVSWARENGTVKKTNIWPLEEN